MLFKLCLFSLIILLLFVQLHAQNKDANLIVSIKNQLGEVVQNADISLIQGNQKPRKIKSNKLGAGRFDKIDIGDYQLIVTAAGFSEYKSETFKLQSGESKQLEITLEVNVIDADVTISNEDNLDDTGTSQILDESLISKLPDDPKALERILRSIAGESVTGEEMPITVDGQTGGQIPPKESIQAIRINQNVLSAQYDNASGWGIEIYTRSNVDKFRGRVSMNYVDSKFNAPDFFIGQKVPMRNYYFSGGLSGPITKTSAFDFWLDYGRNNSSRTINATALDSNLNPISIQTTFPNNSNAFSFGGSVNSDINKKHKAALSFYSSISESTGQNVGDFILPSRVNDSKGNYLNIRASETYFVNEKLINTFRANLNYSFSETYGGSNDPSINVLEAFSGGGAQNDRTNKNINFEATDDLSWQWSKYTLNIGGRLRWNGINQNSRQNFGGSYTFSGRLAPELDSNNNIIFDENGKPTLAQINSLEVYRRTLLFRNLGYSASQIRSLGGGASQFTISGGDPEISINQIDAAFYVQNSYKLKETLALSFGLRYENQTNIRSNFDLAPRIGLIWSPKNDPKTVKPLASLPRVSFGYGIFYNRFWINSFIPIRQVTGDRSNYLINETDILDSLPEVPSVSELEGFATPRTQRFISDSLQSPKMHLFSTNISKKLPLGFSTNFTISHSRSIRQNISRNINPLINGIRPLGDIGNVYETNSMVSGNNTRYSVSLNLPQNIIWGSIRYNFARVRDNRVSAGGSPFDPFDFSQEFGASSGDGVHSLSSYFSYELPYKFSIYGDFTYRTGGRFNIITGRDTNGDGFFSERPAFASDLTKPNLVQTEYGILDPNPSPSDKLIPRNFGKGNPTTSFDLSISKTFGFNEDKQNKKPAKQNLSFSVNIQNVFNIFNRGNPIGNMSSPNFLKTLSNSGGNFIEMSDGVFYSGGNTSPRSLSFNMRFSF